MTKNTAIGTVHTSTRYAQICVTYEIPNVTYSPIPPTGIPPGQVAVLFLSHDPNSSNAGPLTCPVPPALPQDAAVHGSGKGTAFHVVSDTPVSAYDLLPYGGASSYLPSGSLLGVGLLNIEVQRLLEPPIGCFRRIALQAGQVHGRSLVLDLLR